MTLEVCGQSVENKRRPVLRQRVSGTDFQASRRVEWQAFGTFIPPHLSPKFVPSSHHITANEADLDAALGPALHETPNAVLLHDVGSRQADIPAKYEEVNNANDARSWHQVWLNVGNSSHCRTSRRQGMEGYGSSTAARGFGAIGLPPAPGQFAGADAQGGLTEALARLNEGQAQSRVAAQQVTQAADAVVTESTQLGQKTTGALSTLAAALRNTSSQLAALEAEFNAYRDSNR